MVVVASVVIPGQATESPTRRRRRRREGVRHRHGSRAVRGWKCAVGIVIVRPRKKKRA